MLEIDPSTEAAVLKHRRLQLLRKKLDLVKSYGLAFYRPHPKQDTFHRAGDKKRRLVRAGNRFGKSIMGVAEDAAWFMGERPWYGKDDPARYIGIPKHPVKGLIITTDWDKVGEIFTNERGDSPGKMWKFLPKGFIKHKRRNHSGAIDEMIGENGSILRYDTMKSYLSNPLGSESSDWDFIHVDEPTVEDHWKATSRGLVDRHGSAWFTLTPLTQPWINDYFIGTEDSTEIGDSKWSITGSIFDNPYLTPEAIAQFEADLTDEEKQCRLHGIPLHLAGLVYKEFSYAKHVLHDLPKGWTDFRNPPKDYSIYYAIDPHPQTPHAVLFIAVSPFGQIFIYDEIFIHTTIGELSRLIHEKIDGRNVIHAKVDPLAYINDPITDSNMAEEFCKHGIMVEKATKAREQGILRVKETLKKDNTLYFAPSLKETLWEIQRWSWDKDNKPVDKDDHMLENLYRLLLDDPIFIDCETPQENTSSEEEFDGSDINEPMFEETYD